MCREHVTNVRRLHVTLTPRTLTLLWSQVKWERALLGPPALGVMVSVPVEEVSALNSTLQVVRMPVGRSRALEVVR